MVRLSVDEIGQWSGKRVLLRADFNVPLDAAVQITDDFRIKATLPTIHLLSGGGARVILMSHLGRPDGVDKALSLKPIAEHLSQALNKPVTLAPDCVGAEVEGLVRQMQDGDVMMLENLRFHPEENENDPDFARQLAMLGDVYVNDAFASAHRTQASNVGITKYMKICMAGSQMKKEIDEIYGAIAATDRPFVAVIGGGDFAEKTDMIDFLLDHVDHLLVGGQVSLPFLKAKGYPVGDIITAEVGKASEILQRGQAKLHLPTDAVLVREVTEMGRVEKVHRMVSFSVDLDPIVEEMIRDSPELMDAVKNPLIELEPGEKVADIGSNTGISYQEIIRSAQTLVWTGRVGDFDDPLSKIGSQRVTGILAIEGYSGKKCIAGGYDVLPVIAEYGVSEGFSHISTGHRAFFECLKGRSLPGIEALS